MSKNLMDTEPGGEQTQYEGIHTFVKPHSKQAGQLGDPATGTTTELNKAASNAPNTQGVTPAEKMRYGQAISEGGVGGKTTEATGEAATAGGFGGTDALEEQGEGFAKQRSEQGYGGERDMRRDVGA
ncbi:hypothetical protein BS50DRAFT_572303 [Corynespora cassiicola Philippines]|uniref:Uncharacterized protein n=1 Tax=Corynespora cassiicola Philippines TaxID=1448308 RepID=A0A2T2NUP0_CORCC|nr:hypothetical protein BS50DRAFT_572303 [Corynespora cassiicola Philippines]